MYLRKVARALALGLLAAPGLLPAIAAAQAGGGSSGGGEITPPWTVRDNVAAFAAQVQNLKPILDKVDPAMMAREGAPQAYRDVLQSAKMQLEYVVGAANRLRAQPEALSLALETYFRVESLETLLGSTIDGVRKYQSPDLANLLRSAITESANGREKLKQYMVELAANREHELKVMDQEAQRCRQMILKQQAPPASSSSRPRSPSSSSSSSSSSKKGALKQ